MIKKLFVKSEFIEAKEMIRTVDDIEEKQRITKSILTALPEWFGIPESTENYIRESANEIMVASFEGEKENGFLCLKETGKDTVEIAVMGVLRTHHHKGIGRCMFNEAKHIAVEYGYSFIQVKTVQMGKYRQYDETNHFYLSLGFKEFELMPNLWDEWNPCQIYVMSL